MFRHIKKLRSIAMRYDRCHDLFMGAVAIAIIVIFLGVRLMFKEPCVACLAAGAASW